MTIRTQLSLLSAGLVLGVLVLTGVLQYAMESRNLSGEFRRRQRATGERLAHLAEEGLYEKSSEALARAAGGVLEAERLAYVILVEWDGKVLFHSDSLSGGKAPEYLKDARTAAAAAAEGRTELGYEDGGRRVLELVYPLKATSLPTAPDAGPRATATLRIGCDLSGESAAVRAAAGASLRRFLLVALISLAAGLAGASLMAASFSRTLKKLVTGARAIGEGELSHKVMTRRQDELGVLSAEFNMMGQKLAELEAMKQRFLQTVTHDLRSPLVSVKGYVDLMLMGLSGELTEKQREQLEIIARSTVRLSHLINDILDLSKLEAGKMEFEFLPVDISGAIAEVRELLAILAEQYQIKLETDVSGPLPEVAADKEQLVRVVTNLVTNALKFTPAGGTVTVSARPEGDGVRVAVRDTGCGIPKDKLASMFTKFYQVPESKVRARQRGTGLGLTICRHIVEAHGGDLLVESEWEKGSTFSFRLPKRPPPPPAGAAAA